MKLKQFLENTAKQLRPHKKLSLLITILLVFGNIYGCAPSYPKEKLAESLIDICKKNHDIDVQTKLIGKNIVVFIPLDELFNANQDLLPEAVNKIENVILSTSRMLFSTDAEVDFYTIIAADVHVTAAEVILIRCMDDVYKFMHGWISRDEYRKRILWEANYNVELVKDSAFNFDMQEMTLPRFLAEQIAQRVNLSLNASIVHKAKVSGNYIKEQNIFFFSLPVNNNARFTKIYSPIILHFADLVLDKYGFNDYDQIVIRNQLLKNFTIIDKKDLKDYRDVDVDQILTLPYFD
jgi:hypothetical protein